MIVRSLVLAGSLVLLAGSGGAIAAGPGAAGPGAAGPAAAGDRVPAAPVVVAPEVASNSQVRVVPDAPECGGPGFSKIVVPLSPRGFSCVHSAADQPPTTEQARAVAAPAASTRGPATAPVPCYGDGTTGSRVQFIYGYYDGLPNRSKVVIDQVRRYFAPRMQAVFKNQSEGRDLSMRFVWTKGCGAIDVKVVKFPRSVQYGSDPRDPGGQLGRAANTLQALGYNRPDRKYHILWDGWNVGACGIGELIPFDPVTSAPYAPTNQGLPSLGARSNADATNAVNGTGLVSTYSMTFNHAGGQYGPSCFTGRGLSTVTTEIHEVFHTLGAVQLDAPNADTGHCQDAPSVMCSGNAEGYGKGVYIKACGRVLVETLDCGMNDYWAPNPRAGDYLFTHYNIAKSPFFGPQPQDTLAPAPV